MLVAYYVIIVICFYLNALEAWDPGNSGKRINLITWDPGNTGKQTILITWEPGHIGKPIILITREPGNTGKPIILIAYCVLGIGYCVLCTVYCVLCIVYCVLCGRRWPYLGNFLFLRNLILCYYEMSDFNVPPPYGN